MQIKTASWFTDLPKDHTRIGISRGIPKRMSIGPSGCHRALVAKWLAEALGQPVPEFGFEALAQDSYPLWPAGLRPNLTGRV